MPQKEDGRNLPPETDKLADSIHRDVQWVISEVGVSAPAQKDAVLHERVRARMCDVYVFVPFQQ